MYGKTHGHMDELKLYAVVEIGIWHICLSMPVLLHAAVVMAQLPVVGDILVPAPLPAAVAMLLLPAAVVLLDVNYHKCQSN